MKPFLDTLLRRRHQDVLAVRGLPPAPALPALGAPAFAPLPGGGAQPCLFAHGGQSWLFCRTAKAGRGVIAACALPAAAAPRPVLEDEAELACPCVFEAGGQILLLALCGGQPALWRCADFPAKWEPVQRFTLAAPAAALAVPVPGDLPLTVLASMPAPKDARQLRWQRYTLTAEGDGLALNVDETFALQHRAYGAEGCAGADFWLGGQRVRPACVRGAAPAVQFYLSRTPPAVPGPHPREVPLCAAAPHNVQVQGAPRVTGVCGYARDGAFEVLAVQTECR